MGREMVEQCLKVWFGPVFWPQNRQLATATSSNSHSNLKNHNWLLLVLTGFSVILLYFLFTFFTYILFIVVDEVKRIYIYNN